MNEAKAPDFRGKIEVPCWINTTKEGKKYLSIKLFGTTINLFKNVPKPKEEPEIEEETVV